MSLAAAEVTIHSPTAASDLILVYDNHFTFDEMINPRGIFVWISASENWQFIRDTIIITNDEYNFSGGAGIQLISPLISTGSKINSCIVTGDGPNLGEGDMAGIGILVRSPGITVCDNDISQLYEGLRFIGNNDMSIIGLNAHGPCHRGLKLHNLTGQAGNMGIAVTGMQDRRTNTWDSGQNAFNLAAWNQAPPGFWDMSIFTTHSLAALYNPNPFSPSGWFDFESGDSEGCGEISVVFTPYDSAIAAGTDSLLPAGLWEARRALMYKLLKFPSLRSAAGDFFSDGLDSVYGQFAIIDTLIADALLSSRDEETYVDSLNSIIDSIVLEIAFLDSLQEESAVYGDSLGITSDSLAQVKSVYLDSLNTWSAQLTAKKATILTAQRNALENVLEDNDDIQTNAKWEENQKIVNKYRIIRAKYDTLSTNALDSLRDIASSCLDEAGMAVFQAIHLLPVCEWMDYNNPETTACPGSKLYYESSPIGMSDLSVIVTPIPSDNYIELNFNRKIDGLFELVTLTGQVIMQTNIRDSAGLSIDTQHLIDGVYIWNISAGTALGASGKLVIHH
jgi:hypothetical protein